MGNHLFLPARFLEQINKRKKQLTVALRTILLLLSTYFCLWTIRICAAFADAVICV